MTSEYLLDAMGLLDDDLIREAETCPAQRRNPGCRRWATLAACLALALALGYGVTYIGMGGGSGGAPNQAGGTTAGEPSASGMETLPSPGGAEDFAESGSQGGAVPDEPEADSSGGSQGDWLCAIRVDGVIYRDTCEVIHLEPEERDIRYTTSFRNTWDPEEDGQANFEPVGTPYVVLDGGRVAVLWNGDAGTWRVFDSVPPWEK